MSQEKPVKGWFVRHAESEAWKDGVPLSERKGSVVAVVGALIVLLFFVAHQTASTGFFTVRFGLAEALLSYAVIVLGALMIVARVVVGRKNVVRPFDVLFLVLVAVDTVWLYFVFPFDFSHLADVLPSFLRFLLSWVTDDIARVVMILQVLGALFFAVYTGMLYVYVRRELSAAKKS